MATCVAGTQIDQAKRSTADHASMRFLTALNLPDRSSG
jgi:hypothetical protein